MAARSRKRKNKKLGYKRCRVSWERRRVGRHNVWSALKIVGGRVVNSINYGPDDLPGNAPSKAEKKRARYLLCAEGTKRYRGVRQVG